MQAMKVKVIRSKRRKKTVSCREVDELIQLRIPAKSSKKKEREYIEWARERVATRRRRKKLKEEKADELLEKKAKELNKKYFEGKLRWNKIEYSAEQNSNMFGNCKTRDKIIRVSDRLRNYPKFVHDYVVMHELTHLVIPKHGKKFWEVCKQYPKCERAKGYLMAIVEKK